MSGGPNQGTIITATVNCPAGKLLLGGGGSITATDDSFLQKVTLLESIPLDADTWQVKAIITSSLGGSNQVTVTATAICTV